MSRDSFCIRMRAATLAVAGIGVLLVPMAWPADANNSRTLQIYVIDVEGGQSTLLVTPEGQSLLIDTGWPDQNGRDADRIVAAAKHARISRIDYVLLTHYHTDHAGGVPQLVAHISVGTFMDHGANRETADPVTEHGWEEYQKVLATGKYGHITPKPGEMLPVKGIRAVVVSADGNLIRSRYQVAENRIDTARNRKSGQPTKPKTHARREHLLSSGN